MRAEHVAAGRFRGLRELHRPVYWVHFHVVDGEWERWRLTDALDVVEVFVWIRQRGDDRPTAVYVEHRCDGRMILTRVWDNVWGE